jgi:alkylation response protein AidB-like acyl-CoA dehydrogenase
MSDTDIESVESFRLRARKWLAANYPRAEGNVYDRHAAHDDEEELAEVQHQRELQRMLFDAGLAGICFPKEYGGQGLTPAHQRALNDEIVGYQVPFLIQVPPIVPCAAVLLDFGTEEQKLRHIPAILRGDEIWMQFLSEPSGGSDVAGALTTAVRDGDEWVINGSKIWTSGAWFSDYGLALVRTNWDVPKHRGLTVFIIKIDQPGVELHRIEMINGSADFCQEFFTDVRVPDSNRLGEVDQGWTVGTRWMYHEKSLGGVSPYITGSYDAPGGTASAGEPMVDLARAVGHLDDPRSQLLVGEAAMLRMARAALSDRVADGIRSGALPDSAAAIGRLMNGVVKARYATLALEIAGSNAVATLRDEPWAQSGFEYLERQSSSIGGGTTEMARNNISERVLGMPREITHDKNLPFRDVPKGPPVGG